MWMGLEEIKKAAAENSGKTRLPAASRIFLANQRRAGDETKGQWRGKRTFFFHQWTFEDFGEILFVFWTRKGKSLIFFQLFSMLRE